MIQSCQRSCLRWSVRSKFRFHTLQEAIGESSPSFARGSYVMVLITRSKLRSLDYDVPYNYRKVTDHPHRDGWVGKYLDRVEKFLESRESNREYLGEQKMLSVFQTIHRKLTRFGRTD